MSTPVLFQNNYIWTMACARTPVPFQNNHIWTMACDPPAGRLARIGWTSSKEEESPVVPSRREFGKDGHMTTFIQSQPAATRFSQSQPAAALVFNREYDLPDKCLLRKRLIHTSLYFHAWFHMGSTSKFKKICHLSLQRTFQCWVNYI